MNKKELKELVEFREREIVELHNRIDSLLEQNAKLAESQKQSYQWYQDAKKRAEFYTRCLSKLRYVIALDVIQDSTHRSRNEYWRHWQQTIFNWLSSDLAHCNDIDDIPF